MRSRSVVLAAGLVAALAVGRAPWAAGAQQPPAKSLGARLTSGERAAIAKLPAGAGKDLVVGNCVTCHSASLLVVQHKDTAGWNKTVTQMMGWGATLPPERKAEVVAYLAEHFPALGPAPSPASRP